MRCPKCGYISFDHAETCSKCKKDISAQSEQLSGTILMAEAPAYLQFNMTESDGMGVGRGIDVSPDETKFQADPAAAVENEEPETGDEIAFDFPEEDSGSSGADGQNESEDFDLPLNDDDEIEIVMEEEESADTPQVDFSGLDISDLAPPGAERNAAEELTLEGVEEAVESASSVAPSAAVTSGLGGAAGLEDLSMDGIDLETPSLPPVGSVTGEKFRPAVKTGTALDNFDFDLGDLVSGEEK